MHCNICDKQLSEKEISWNDDLQTYEPCTTCLDVALEAAYSGNFKRDEEDDRFVLLEDFEPEDDYGQQILSNHRDYD